MVQRKIDVKLNAIYITKTGANWGVFGYRNNENLVSTVVNKGSWLPN
ncbi:hypothetical protein ACFYKT_12845 [Cytobacillus sp. FJAT-53684]|uniref:Uncharacterized protein n=1 Tax=Cytobacillus mangrovibacter TaxID=3299024 RepID=A0ABW6JZ86_9BACI